MNRMNHMNHTKRATFPPEFFARHQAAILLALNFPVIGRRVRARMGIDDLPFPVVKITPNACHFHTMPGTFRAVVYSNRQYGEGLKRLLDPVLAVLHAWDIHFANPLIPALNTGLDTYSQQPDPTAGYDTMISDANTSTNYDGIEWISIGDDNALVDVRRALIKFDLSSIPSTLSGVTSATLSLWVHLDRSSNARNCSVYRILRNWVETQATWLSWKNAFNWTTAGCGSDGNDADLTTVWATTLIGASETVGTEIQWSLNTTEFKKICDGTYTNYGWLMKMASESNDQHRYRSSDYTTDATQRPKLVVVYTVPVTFRRKVANII